MSLFGKIWDKISDPWGVAKKKDQDQESASRPVQSSGRPVPTAPVTPAIASSSSTSQMQSVDVEQVLTDMAAKHSGGGGNWRTSIVDLLKLLDLDSSLDARKELAAELNVNAGPAGSAEQNIALHKAVMRKLADNGGKVPADLRD